MKRTVFTTFFAFALNWLGCGPCSHGAAFVLESDPAAQLRPAGVLGERLEVNRDEWLHIAPRSNPGMVGMFQWRDWVPKRDWVPWAGEFAGKYLQSAVLGIRLSGDEALRHVVQEVVEGVIAAQGEDGYLGPFPKEERLLKHWDLWGHYHVISGLLAWHELTGDQAALRSARKGADLICRTFLTDERRVSEAGSVEMNMSIIHALGRLYRLTGHPPYLELMRKIELEWPEAGDYLGVAERHLEFWEGPKPRWESLHNLQGLVELYQITGEVRYKEAFLHHWRSLARSDQRQTGGFSSAEQATGNIYAPTPIETCGTVAWSAVTVDALRLTGRAEVADRLELALWNAVAGAQHPSGRWWTYDTPMAGVRQASAHSIVFQARAGTPELNCCSVNGPRALGLVADWAVMRSEKGLAVNLLAPGSYHGKLPDRTPVGLMLEGDYPVGNSARIRVEPAVAREFELAVRLPTWLEQVTARVNRERWQRVEPGTYVRWQRNWMPGDVVEVRFALPVWMVSGNWEARGHVSLYKGPLLLAADEQWTGAAWAKRNGVDAGRLGEAKAVRAGKASSKELFDPWLAVDVPAAGGGTLRLIDFASAGGSGSRYGTWLNTAQAPPAPVFPRWPRDSMVLPVKPFSFVWRGTNQRGRARHKVVVARDADFGHLLWEKEATQSGELGVAEEVLSDWPTGQWLHWKVVSMSLNGRTESRGPHLRFRLEKGSKEQVRDIIGRKEGLWQEVIRSSFATGLEPEFGSLLSGADAAIWVSRFEDGQREAMQLDGRSKILYEVGAFPEENYSAALWVKLLDVPQERLGQIVSTWHGPMDDPLRLVVEDGKLHARIEAGQAYSTGGARLEPSRWHHVAAVKKAERLVLYVDGKPAGQTAVPAFIFSRASQLALGGNPRFAGDEHIHARFSEFQFWARALSTDEVEILARR